MEYRVTVTVTLSLSRAQIIFPIKPNEQEKPSEGTAKKLEKIDLSISIIFAFILFSRFVFLVYFFLPGKKAKKNYFTSNDPHHDIYTCS